MLLITLACAVFSGETGMPHIRVRLTLPEAQIPLLREYVTG